MQANNKGVIYEQHFLNYITIALALIVITYLLIFLVSFKNRLRQFRKYAFRYIRGKCTFIFSKTFNISERQNHFHSRITRTIFYVKRAIF